MGRIPVTLTLGDFMQLGPVRKQGMPEHSTREARNLQTEDGWRIYKKFTDVVLLTETKRFRDAWLPWPLDTIRQPTARARKIRGEVQDIYKDVRELIKTEQNL